MRLGALLQCPQVNLVAYGPKEYLKTKKIFFGLETKILPPSDPKPPKFVMVLPLKTSLPMSETQTWAKRAFFLGHPVFI